MEILNGSVVQEDEELFMYWIFNEDFFKLYISYCEEVGCEVENMEIFLDYIYTSPFTSYVNFTNSLIEKGIVEYIQVNDED